MSVAEKDTELKKCYWNREKYVERAEDFNDPIIFFIGPKGMGKSAILQMVRNDNTFSGKTIVNIYPDDLAFSSISQLKATDESLLPKINNQWLFKTLWDYVLSIEILKKEYSTETSLWQRLKGLFDDESEKRASRLIRSAYSDGTYKVNMTDRIIQLIKELELSVSTNGVSAKGKVSFNEPTSNVSTLLNDINHIIKEIGNIVANKYYVLIDDLDSYWENDPTQNSYIAALFNSLRKFESEGKIKFVVALREDILSEIPLLDKDKLRDRIENVFWDKGDLKLMLERRLVSVANISYEKVWDGFFDGDYFDYLIKHTNETPRELIRLCELCYLNAVRNGSGYIVKTDIDEALAKFSEEELENLDIQVQYRFKGLRKIVLKLFYGIEKEFDFGRFENKFEELITDPKLMANNSEVNWIQGFETKDAALMLMELGILLHKATRTSRPEKFNMNYQDLLGKDCHFAISSVYAPGLRCLGT